MFVLIQWSQVTTIVILLLFIQGSISNHTRHHVPMEYNTGFINGQFVYFNNNIYCKVLSRTKLGFPWRYLNFYQILQCHQCKLSIAVCVFIKQRKAIRDHSNKSNLYSTNHVYLHRFSHL